MRLGGHAGYLMEQEIPGHIVMVGTSRHGYWESRFSGLFETVEVVRTAAELTAALHGKGLVLLFFQEEPDPSVAAILKAAEARPGLEGALLPVFLMQDQEIAPDLIPSQLFGNMNVFDFLHPGMSAAEILFRIRRAALSASSGPENEAKKDGLMEVVQPVARFRRWENLIARLDRWMMPEAHDGHPRPAGLAVLSLDRFERMRAVMPERDMELLLESVELRLGAAFAEYYNDDTRQGEVMHVQDDEFALIFGGDVQVQDVARATRQALVALKDGIDVNDAGHYLSACAGISLAPGDAGDAAHLVHCAQTALGAAKEKGMDNYHFYSEEHAAEALQRFDLENRLRRAIKNDEFELFYQPQVDISTGAIACFEALVRWNHPELGLVFPDTFLPLAHAAGLGDEIGDFVLSRGIADLARWRAEGLRPARIALNVTGDMFNNLALSSRLDSLLREYQVDARHITLELTESIVLHDIERTLETMQSLKNLGLHMAIDDFGTGYNSLSYLKFLPFDYLKIDKTFIADLGDQAEDRAMLQAIIGLVKTLDMAVVAEGVETAEQLDYLMAQGCDFYQGFLCAKAMPWSEVMEFVLRWNARQAGRKGSKRSGRLYI